MELHLHASYSYSYVQTREPESYFVLDKEKKKIQHRDTDRILMFTGEKGSSTDINISVKTASLPLNTCFNRLALLSWESNGREENR